MNHLNSTQLVNRTEFKNSIKADLWLVFICIIWGLSFSLVKIALHDASLFLFLSIRFGLGGLFLLPFILLQKRMINRDRLRRGSLLGLFMFLGMFFQTAGLQYTTASNSGFITGMSVVIVPILVLVIEHQWPKWPVLIGVLFAVAGLFCLTQPQTQGFNNGDMLTLISAICFSFEIVYIELLVKKDEALVLAFIMICTTAVLATLSSVFGETRFFIPTRSLLLALGFVALFCTALGFSMQTYWQPKTSATAASVIYTTEPVFAAIFAGMILQERLNSFGWIGGGLIIGGMLIAELRRRS